MSLLLETSLGDIVIDLDLEGSPILCKNIIKLAKARYYTGTLVHTVVEGRYCQLGDPRGDGGGGCSIFGLIDSLKNNIVDVRQCPKRFIRSTGRKLTPEEIKEKGIVAAIEMGGVKDTIGSQFLISVDSGEERALHGTGREYFSLGRVVEDENDVLGQLNTAYCDKHGRPYADVRIVKAYILDDPFDDPPDFQLLMNQRNIILMDENDLPKEHCDCARWLSSSSPTFNKPAEEVVEIRISAIDAKAEVDEEIEKKRRAELEKKEERSHAVMLEMLGDLPSADMKPPENVLFVCKLNPVTNDEDLTLIFSRFDPNAKAEIIRDQETGDSLQYAFVEFDTEAACNEAYFKMNNALIDDRRIKVDFSQSVAKEWNRYAQRRRIGTQSHIRNNPTNKHEYHASSSRHTNQRHRFHDQPSRNSTTVMRNNGSMYDGDRRSTRTNEVDRHDDYDQSKSRRARSKSHNQKYDRRRRGRSYSESSRDHSESSRSSGRRRRTSSKKRHKSYRSSHRHSKSDRDRKR